MISSSRSVLRWVAAFLLVVVLAGGLVGRAQAVVIDGGGVIPAGTTIDDDLVLGATRVSMDGTVNGTLIAAGQVIAINGTVHGDVIAAGQELTLGEKAVIDGNLFVASQQVTLNGKVSGSVFGAAASLVMNASSSVTRNLYSAGYDLQLRANSKVGRDVLSADYQANLAGEARNLQISAAAIDISGTVSGDATLRVAPPDARITPFSWRFGQMDLPPAARPGLRIAESAKIGGKLTYTSESDQSATIQSSPAGGAVYQTPVPERTDRSRAPRPAFEPPFFNVSGFWLWAMLRNLATIIILGALALWLVPGIFDRALGQLRERSLASLGMGLLSLIAALFVIPVIAIALVLLGLFFAVLTLVDLAGIFAGLGFLVFILAVSVYFILFAWAGKLLISYSIGAWVLSRLAPQAAVQRIWVLVLGALIFALLAAIPFAGFLLTFLVDLAGIGALWYAWRSRKIS